MRKIKKLSTLNLVQLGLWATVVVLGMGLGLTDLLVRSFVPEFNSKNFGLFFFSLTIVSCIVGSCPILYLFLGDKDGV